MPVNQSKPKKVLDIHVCPWEVKLKVNEIVTLAIHVILINWINVYINAFRHVNSQHYETAL